MCHLQEHALEGRLFSDWWCSHDMLEAECVHLRLCKDIPGLEHFHHIGYIANKRWPSACHSRR